MKADMFDLGSNAVVKTGLNWTNHLLAFHELQSSPASTEGKLREFRSTWLWAFACCVPLIVILGLESSGRASETFKIQLII